MGRDMSQKKNIHLLSELPLTRVSGTLPLARHRGALNEARRGNE